MSNKTPNRTAQGILLVVMFIVFWKSQHPVIVATTFIVLTCSILNVFIHIHNRELDKKVIYGIAQHNGKHILLALLFQVITIALMGLLTWALLYKKADIFRILF